MGPFIALSNFALPIRAQSSAVLQDSCNTVPLREVPPGIWSCSQGMEEAEA